MKTLGIVLAGGMSTRMRPATHATTKQLLPVYDKPLVYYPLSLLLLAGIRDIVIVTSPFEREAFMKLICQSLGDRSEWQSQENFRLTLAIQPEAKGIADVFNVKEVKERFEEGKFDRVCLVLGDNILYGSTVTGELKEANESKNAVIFGQRSNELERFGVVTTYRGLPLRLKEKPDKHYFETNQDCKHYAVIGVYFYPADVFDKVTTLNPSARGELEITDLNTKYMIEGECEVKILKRGVSWFDCGTPDAMLDTAQYVKTIQQHQNILVGSPHEIGYNNGIMCKDRLLMYIESNPASAYSQKLKEIIEDEV